ncbi:MAG: 2-C-methyl-D-erythritol 4-phosphate cytidylyltransferase [Anaerolineae bacterium]|nr:2-C-methyl-D-erythritol 4-phosphate cytidylyltransferase [Gloeobacterales cyanobacterium ES-bin-313]
MQLLIPAAGRGSRMGAPVNKLLLPVLDRPVLAWTLAAADQAKSISRIGIIGQPAEQEEIAALLEKFPIATPVQWIEGGETRQESVYRGLLAVVDHAERVLIHDGARCLATPELFNRCAEALQNFPALIAAVQVRDTIKQVAQDGRIEKTIPRESLWAAQTPQGFVVKPLLAYHRLAREQNLAVTDDAALWEWQGQSVVVVPGEETNIKVTTPADLALAAAILGTRLSKTQP